MRVAALFAATISFVGALGETARCQQVISGSREFIAERFSVAGKKTALDHFVSLRPNCTTAEWQDLSIVKKPEHGTASIKDGRAAASYIKDNPRSACNGKVFASKMVEFVPSKNYKGFDVLAVEAISSDGGLTQVKYRITIK